MVGALGAQGQDVNWDAFKVCDLLRYLESTNKHLAGKGKTAVRRLLIEVDVDGATYPR